MNTRNGIHCKRLPGAMGFYCFWGKMWSFCKAAGVLVGVVIGLGSLGFAASLTRTATTASNTSGWTDWTTAQLGSSNNSFAGTYLSASATGVLYGFDFSSIPAGSSIVGIEVKIEAMETNGAVNGYLETFVSWNDGTSYSSLKRSPSSGEVATSDTVYTTGGPTDIWGHPWTWAEVTTNFRVKIVAYDESTNATRYLTVDHVTVTVYYTPDTTAPSASTIASVSGYSSDKIKVTWNSAGDDGSSGNLTGNYRIQYATYTVAWSTSSTPTNATTVTTSVTEAAPGSAQLKEITGLTEGTTYYFVLWSQDDATIWSGISNTISAFPYPPIPTVSLSEAVGQVGWLVRGDTQRILGTAEVVSNIDTGLTISSVAVLSSGYTGDGNLTNVEVWLSSSGYIDGTAIRLDGTAKGFSGNAAVFDQDIVIRTTPLFFIVRSDVSGSAAEGTFDIALQVFTTANTSNNPIAFSNATDVVAPPSGVPSNLVATPVSNLPKMTLSWTGATGADSYLIYCASHSGVTTSDALLGGTSGTSFTDDSMLPNQLKYYAVVGTNRAGVTAISDTASGTTVDTTALIPGYIYLRAGVIPSNSSGNGVPLINTTPNSAFSQFVDRDGNLYIALSAAHVINFVPRAGGSYFGQVMAANCNYTIAGNGVGGYLVDNVAATSTRLYSPGGVSVDAGGNVYIADYNNHRIRFVPKMGGTYFGQVMTANYIYTIAGTGSATYGGDGGPATLAQISYPIKVTVDAGGNLYISDYNNHRIRVIPKEGGTYFGQSMTANSIYTIAGTGSATYGGDGGPATLSQINFPSSVAVDAGGSLYISDYNNHRIRFIPKNSGTHFGQSMTANNIYTIAGNGTGGYLADDVAATSTRLFTPAGVSLDAGGNVYIADYNNYRIRFIPKAGGTYFGQTMMENYIYTIVGNGTVGAAGNGGVATSANIYSPSGMHVDYLGNIYVAYNNASGHIRFVPKTTGSNFGQSMVANSIYGIAGYNVVSALGDDGLANTKSLYLPFGLTVDTNKNIYIADSWNHRLCFVPKTSGTYFGRSMTANFIYRIAGDGTFGTTAYNVMATNTPLSYVWGVDVDNDGNIYIAHGFGYRVCFIPKTDGTYFGQTMTANYIYSIAGTGSDGYGADNVAATSTPISYIYGVSVDINGNVYVPDTDNDRIRFIPRVGGTNFGQTMTANRIYTIAGNGTSGYLADNVAATSTRVNSPRGLNVDGNGNVYIADRGNHRIRFVPKTGGTYFGQTMTANYIYTIAGNGTGGYVADNVAATNTQINNPPSVDVDTNGNVYISDSNNYRTRFVPKVGGTYFGQTMTVNYIYTIGGTGVPGTPTNGDGASATTINIYPIGISIDSDDMVNFVDGATVRMIAGGTADVISPSTSTLSAVTGSGGGVADLSWASAGDDGSTGDLTGNYRIQYATYSATWATGSTPTNATTITIATTSVTPGVVQSTTIAGLSTGMTYYFGLFTQDESSNWSNVSNTASAMAPYTVTLAEAVGQAGWMGRGETQRILGTAQVVSDSTSGVTISSVAVQASGYTADGNLTNVEVWISSSGYIDANAIQLDGTAKAFSSDVALFNQDVTVSTTPLYFIARADVSGSASVGTFELSLELYTTAVVITNPLPFSNATDVVAPPSGSPSGLSATAASNLLQVNLSWGSATGSDTYSIYRATHSGVTTTDFLLGITNTTSFADDYIPPAQQMYYTVVGTNRAGSSGSSGAANATSADVAALTTSNIYLRAGSPGNFGNGGMAYNETLNGPYRVFIDHAGNIYVTEYDGHRVRFVPKTSGTYFGVSMTANALYTIAGDGTGETTGDGGLASAAHLFNPAGVTVDLQGNVYVVENSGHVLRFIPQTSGTYFGVSMTANYIYTLAGDPWYGGSSGDGGLASASRLASPFGVEVDAAGNVYIADTGNSRVRFIPKTSGTYFGVSMTANYIYKIAGTTDGNSGDGGLATSAQFFRISSVAVDAGGNLYIVDHYNRRIRFVPKTSGTYFGVAMVANYVYRIAGGGGSLGDGGLATSAYFDYPGVVRVDGGGNVYISDGQNRIRFIPKTSGTYFGSARTANYIYTIAGTGTEGLSGDGGAATSAKISGPEGVSVDPGGNVYFVDGGNNRLRMVPKTTGTYFGQARTANNIYTLVGNGASTGGDNGVATAAGLGTPTGVATDSAGNIYIAMLSQYRILFIPKTSGSYFGISMTANSLYAIAGTGIAGYSGDGGPATAAKFAEPYGVSVDSEGNVYVADKNGSIRFIPKGSGTYFGVSMTANSIYTIAGDAIYGYSGDGGPATAAQFQQSARARTDGDGNLYVADYNSSRIRFVPKTSGTYFGVSMTAHFIYTIVGNGTSDYGAMAGQPAQRHYFDPLA
jgi:hypothetical protein